jgi:holliday junction DNA helicase RuvA
LTGTIAQSEANSVIVDVNGVGYLVLVPETVRASLPEVGGKATLKTLLLLRGQPDIEMTLYGFSDDVELRVFKLLIATSGVGPKAALALLSHLSVGELSRALSTGDTRAITKVPGVGPKLAQRLCLELGDKMAELAFVHRTERAAAGADTAQENAAYEDVIEALVGLGYSRADARRAADRVFAGATDKTDASKLISAALVLLTAGKKV